MQPLPGQGWGLFYQAMSQVMATHEYTLIVLTNYCILGTMLAAIAM